MMTFLAPMLAVLSHLGPFTKIAVLAAMALFGISLALIFYRLAIGPETEDRLLALDALYINALAVTLLLGIVFATTIYFEAALIIAMFGFVGTVVGAKFLARGDIVE